MEQRDPDAPIDSLNLQTASSSGVKLESKARQKLLGSILWDIFDIVTFGAFEKRGKKAGTRK